MVTKITYFSNILGQSKEFDQKMSLISGKASLFSESFSHSKFFFLVIAHSLHDGCAMSRHNDRGAHKMSYV